MPKEYMLVVLIEFIYFRRVLNVLGHYSLVSFHCRRFSHRLMTFDPSSNSHSVMVTGEDNCASVGVFLWQLMVVT